MFDRDEWNNAGMGCSVHSFDHHLAGLISQADPDAPWE
jgi:hypothetical protein